MSLTEYPRTLDIREAADLALRLLPERYTDRAAVTALIRNRAMRGGVPGAVALKLPSQERHVWRYDRDKLFHWLSDDAQHRAGRKPAPPKPKKGKKNVRGNHRAT